MPVNYKQPESIFLAKYTQSTETLDSVSSAGKVREKTQKLQS